MMNKSSILFIILSIMFILWMVYANVCFQLILQYNMSGLKLAVSGVQTILKNMNIIFMLCSIMGVAAVIMSIISKRRILLYTIYICFVLICAAVFNMWTDNVIDMIRVSVDCNMIGSVQFSVEEYLQGAFNEYAIVCVVLSLLFILVDICNLR